MQRFKVFTSASCANDMTRLESAINHWIESERPHIHFMAQSSLDAHLIVSFIYAAPAAESAAGEATASVPAVFERTLAQADLDPTDAVYGPLPAVELPY